jgi:hypothetical protein
MLILINIWCKQNYSKHRFLSKLCLDKTYRKYLVLFILCVLSNLCLDKTLVNIW